MMQLKQPKSLFHKTICYLAIAIFFLLGSLGIKHVNAQNGWSQAQALFYPEPGWGSIGPSLVSDLFGYAHLAWSHRPNETGETPAIFYSRWDGANWTEPLDIFVTNGWPVLVPDGNGKLHLFWYADRSVNYSWAWIEQADSVWAWSDPVGIATCDEACSTQIDARLDKQGELHVVYAYREGNVNYVYSTDETTSWSRPKPISNVTLNRTTFIPRLDVSENGRLHATWSEIQLPESRYLGSYYAYSTDGGDSWSQPLELGSGNHADGNILAVGDNEVHLAWNGGVGVGGRYYIYSNDGGVAWSEPVRISSQAGRAGYPSIVQDSLDNLHIMIAQGEHVTQVAGRWTLPEELPFFDPTVEQSRLTILNGNQLLAVVPIGFNTIYYSVKQIDAPTILAKEFPETASTFTATTDAMSPNARTDPNHVFIEEEHNQLSLYHLEESPPIHDQSPYTSIFVALVTSLFVISIGIFLQYFWAKTR